MKYSLTDETRPLSEFLPDVESHRTVSRIKAERDISIFGIVKGDIGGWVETGENLDQLGDCWIGKDVLLYDKALVADSAYIEGDTWIGGMCEIFSNSKLSGFIRLEGHHTISNVFAEMDEWKTLSNTTGTWEPHNKNHLILKGKMIVQSLSTKWTAPGTIEGTVFLKGKEVMVSGAVEVNGNLMIEESHVGNSFCYGNASILDSYMVGQDGDHHLLHGNIVVRESSLHGVFYAKGQHMVLDKVINNGITSLTATTDVPLELFDVQFYDVIHIIQDNTERKLLQNKVFNGDLKLKLTEIFDKTP